MKYLSLGISIALTVFIFSMSQATGEESASLSVTLAQWIHDHVIPSGWIDLETLHLVLRKAAHLGEYAVLGISYALTFRLFHWPLGFLIVMGHLVALGDDA